MTIIALPWPWSVPRLPFSPTARPNSDIVRTTVSAMRSPRSVTSAAMPRAKSSSRVGELTLRRALVDVRVPAADVGERDLEADVRLR